MFEPKDPAQVLSLREARQLCDAQILIGATGERVRLRECLAAFESRGYRDRLPAEGERGFPGIDACSPVGADLGELGRYILAAEEQQRWLRGEVEAGRLELTGLDGNGSVHYGRITVHADQAPRLIAAFWPGEVRIGRTVLVCVRVRKVGVHPPVNLPGMKGEDLRVRPETL